MCSVLHAQDAIPKNTQKQFEEAKTAYQHFELQKSLELLNRITSRVPGYPDGWMLMALVSKELGLLHQAEKAYLTAFNLDSIEYVFAGIKAAEFLFQRGKYSQADTLFRKIHLSDNQKDISIRQDYKALKLNLDFALGSLDQYTGHPVVEWLVAVNTQDDEYFPSLSVNGRSLVFTRQKNRNEKGPEDLYESKIINGTFNRPENLGPPINTSGNEGTQSMRQDGRLIFFTACDRQDGKGGCDLYSTIKIGGDWTIPQNLGYPVNTRYWESTPCIFPDGLHLLFSSNRPGGQGGMDLWVSAYDRTEGWMSPVNMGPKINTAGNEMAPYVSVDGTKLYYSTDGKSGMGGLDIFITDIHIDSVISEPHNLGYPVNTFADEIGFTLTHGGDTAYFSSNRDTVNKQDIYRIEIPKAYRPQKAFPVTGRTVDAASNEPVQARVYLKDLNDRQIAFVDSDPETGILSIAMPLIDSVAFVVQKKGYFYFRKVYHRNDIEESADQFEIRLQKITTGDTKILNCIYFDFDSFSLLPESDSEIQEIKFLLEENKNVAIEISGHTDQTGSDQYNLELSKKRAIAVKSRLIEMGINPDRIKTIGYGSTRPLDNSEDNQNRNRRTEILIL